MKKIILSLLVFGLLFGCTTKTEDKSKHYEGKSLEQLGLVEEDVVFGEQYQLTGKITYPKNLNQQTPAVLLVQGMGPADMNQTMGPTEMMKDLAYGLASQGMIVMRFDKRTYLYGSEMEKSPEWVNFTYKEEVVDDVLLAKEVLTSFKYTDKDHVFMVGHSLGGTLAPVIDQESPFTGLVMLGATPSKITDIAITQTERFIEKTKDETSIQAMQADIDSFKELQLMSMEESKTISIYGIYGYYFKVLDELDSLSILKSMNKPVLILQGSADFQVFPEMGYDLYKQALGSKKNFEFHMFEGLNHLFMPTTGLGTREEYEHPAHINQEVIDSISDFILSH